MAVLQLSVRAEQDLLTEIADYTLRVWGAEQTIRYLSALEECCRKLASPPRLGRACDNIRPGLRRMEHGRHVIFYRRDTQGILVSRGLHQGMLPEKMSADAEAGEL